MFHHDVLEQVRHILGRIRRGQKIDHYETRRQRKDGTVINVSLTVSPIRNGHGEIVGASKIGRDITAQKRHESERREAERAVAAAREAALTGAAGAVRARDEVGALAASDVDAGARLRAGAAVGRAV